MGDIIGATPVGAVAKESGKLFVNSAMNLLQTMSHALDGVEQTEMQREINNIAKNLYDYIDNHAASLGDAEFDKQLKRITTENVVGVLEKFKRKSGGESLIKMIVDESGSDDREAEISLLGAGDGRTSVRGVFVLLLEQAVNVGVDEKTANSFLQDFKTEFNRICRNRGGWPYIARGDAKKLDEITNNVINLIKLHVQAMQEPSSQTAPEPASQTQRKTIDNIQRRYDQAKKDYDAQKKTEGWAAAVADIWGEYFSTNGNYEEAVEADLRIAEKDLERLNAALEKGEDSFKETFYRVFEVSYDAVAIRNYETQEARYIAALQAAQNEETFNTKFSNLLASDVLREETAASYSPSANISYYHTAATKQQVYDREYANLMGLLAQSFAAAKGSDKLIDGFAEARAFIEEKIAAAGKKDASIDEKYKVLHDIVKQMSNNLKQQRQNACGGSSLDKIKQQYDNAYKAAYGLHNDIMQRVTDYNISQQKGAGVVKGIAVAAAAITIGVVTGGSGTAAVLGAGGGTAAGTAAAGGFGAVAPAVLQGAGMVSGLTFLAEVSDRMSSSNGLSLQDLGVAVKASMMSGAMCLVFGAQSYAITNLTVKAGMAAGMSQTAAGYTSAVANGAGILGTGLGTEYLLTGEISTEGATFTVIMAITAAGMQILQVNKAAAAMNETPEARFNREFSNAKALLGISDETQITEELLKQVQREQTKLYHPDGMFPTDASPELIQGATELFQLRQQAIEFLGNVLKNGANLTPQVQPALPLQQTITKTNPETGAKVPAVKPSKPAATTQQQAAQTIPLNRPSQTAGAMAAAGSGPSAQVPITGGAAPVAGELVGEVAARVTSQQGIALSSTIPNLKGGTIDIYTNTSGQPVLNVVKDPSGNIVHTIEASYGADDSFSVTETFEGMGTPLRNEIQQTIQNAEAKVVSSENETAGATNVTYGKDADGNVVKTTLTNDISESVTYTDGSTSITQMTVGGKLIGSYITNGGENGVYVDAKGMIVTEDAFSDAVSEATQQAISALPPDETPVSPQGTVTGGAAPQATVNGIDLQQTISNVNSNVVSSQNEVVGNTTVNYGKNADGQVIKTAINNGVVESTQYIDGTNIVTQVSVGGNVVAHHVSHDASDGVYTDAKGNIITEDQYNELVSSAATNTPTNEPVQQSGVGTADQPDVVSQPIEGAATELTFSEEFLEAYDLYANDPGRLSAVNGWEYDVLENAATPEELQYIIDNAQNDFEPSHAQSLTEIAQQRLDYLNQIKDNPIAPQTSPEAAAALQSAAPAVPEGKISAAGNLGDGYTITTMSRRGRTSYNIQSVEINSHNEPVKTLTYNQDGSLKYAREQYTDAQGNQVIETYDSSKLIGSNGFSTDHPWFNVDYQVRVTAPDGSVTTTTYNLDTGDKLVRTFTPAKDNGEPVYTHDRSVISPEEQQAIRTHLSKFQPQQAISDAQNFVPKQENVYNVVKRVTEQEGVQLTGVSQRPTGGTIETYSDANGKLVLSVFKTPYSSSGSDIQMTLEFVNNEQGYPVKSVETYADGSTVTVTFAGDGEFPTELSRVERDAQGNITNQSETPVPEQPTEPAPPAEPELTWEQQLDNAVKNCGEPQRQTIGLFGNETRELYTDEHGNQIALVERDRDGNIEFMEIATYETPTSRPQVTTVGEQGPLSFESIDRVSAQEIQEFKEYLDKTFPNNEENNAELLKSFRRAPNGTKKLINLLSERDLYTDEITMLAESMEENPEACTRLLLIKGDKPTSHSTYMGDGVGWRYQTDDYRLSPRTVKILTETEAKNPGVISQIVNDPIFADLDINPNYNVAHGNILEYIAEGYGHNPQLVRDIYTAVNKALKSDYVFTELTKDSITDPDGVQQFINDPDFANFSFIARTGHHQWSLTDAITAYKKNPALFRQFANGTEVELVPDLVDAYEINPVLTETLRQDPRKYSPKEIKDIVVKSQQPPEPPTTPTGGKKPYTPPQVTETSIAPQSDVMASSPVSSSNYLGATDRVLHPRNFARAKQLQQKGMEVQFDPATGKARVLVEPSGISQEDFAILPNTYKNVVQITGHESAGSAYQNHSIYKYAGKQDGKVVFEIEANDISGAMQTALDIAEGRQPIAGDNSAITENMQTFEQSIEQEVNYAKDVARYDLFREFPESYMNEVRDLIYTEENMDVTKPYVPFYANDVIPETLSHAQQVKVDILAKYGITVELDGFSDASGVGTIKFTQDGQTSVIETHVAVKNDGTTRVGLSRAFDEFVDAKIDEAIAQSKKNKSTKVTGRPITAQNTQTPPAAGIQLTPPDTQTPPAAGIPLTPQNTQTPPAVGIPLTMPEAAPAPQAAEYTPIVPVENSYSNSQIINIYSSVDNVNLLIAEYRHINGAQYPIHRAILEDIIEDKTGMDIDEVLKATENGGMLLVPEQPTAVTIPLNPAPQVGAMAAAQSAPAATPEAVTTGKKPYTAPQTSELSMTPDEPLLATPMSSGSAVSPAPQLTPMQADTGIAPLGSVTYQEASRSLMQYMVHNGLKLVCFDGFWGKTYSYENSKGQVFRQVSFEDDKVSMDRILTYDENGVTSDTYYYPDGSIMETGEVYYDAQGNKSYAIKVTSGDDKVQVWEYDENGNSLPSKFMTVEEAEAKYGHKIKHTELLNAPESPTPAVTPSATPAAPLAQTPTVSAAQGPVPRCEIPSSMPQTKASIGNVDVTVAGGDMTLIKADAFVVPEFNGSASLGGVGSAVSRRGASAGMKAYDDYISQNGKLNTGDIVMTESGGGNSNYLIHAATVDTTPDNAFDVVQNAVYNALKTASAQGIKSIAIPAMSTGFIGNLTDEQSAQAILSAVNKFANEGGQMDVSVVVYSRGQSLTDFNSVLASKSYENPTPLTTTPSPVVSVSRPTPAVTGNSASSAAYEPIIPLNQGNSTAEMDKIYRSISDTNRLIEEYKFYQGKPQFDFRSITLKYIIQERLGKPIEEIVPPSPAPTAVQEVQVSPAEVYGYEPIIPFGQGNSTAEMDEIYRGVSDTNRLIEEYKFYDGKPEFDFRRITLKYIIQERTGLPIEEAVYGSTAPQNTSAVAAQPASAPISVQPARAQSNSAMEAILSQNDAKIVNSRSFNNPDKTVYYDAAGRELKTEFTDDNGVYRTEITFAEPQENGITAVAKTRYGYEVTVANPEVKIFDSVQKFNKGFTTYDLEGTTKRSVYSVEGKCKDHQDRFDIVYNSEGKETTYIQTVYDKNGGHTVTTVDLEAGTKVIFKKDSDSRVTQISETGISDEPEFLSKNDIIRRSADVWRAFPTMKKALSNGSFDCNGAKIFVETLREKTDICQTIMSLKKADGSPRFTQDEVISLVINCRSFLEDSRLMSLITSPRADGSYRDPFEIWRTYVDSDETGVLPVSGNSMPAASAVEQSGSPSRISRLFQSLKNFKIPYRLKSKLHDDFHVTGDMVMLRSYCNAVADGLTREQIFDKFFDRSRLSADEIPQAYEWIDNLAKRINDIDDSFKRVIPALTPETYYRGIKDDADSRVMQIIQNAQVGDIIVPDAGYSWYTPKASYAEGFASSIAQDNSKIASPDRCVVMKIKTPAGARFSRDITVGFDDGIPEISGINPYSSMNVVTQRAIQYKVLDKEVKNGRTYITLQYLGPSNNSPITPAGTSIPSTGVEVPETSGSSRIRDAVTYVKNKVTGTKTLDMVLNKARKEGAIVENLGNGEYKVTQKHLLRSGEIQPVGSSAEKYDVETVEIYKEGSTEPVEITKYHTGIGGEKPVFQKTVRTENGYVHSITDRQTGYGVEYHGYDREGNPVQGQQQAVKIIGKDGSVLAEYTGDDIEAGLLAPRNNTTDDYSGSLLSVRSALSVYGVGQSLVDWQVYDGTKHLVANGQQFNPERFVRPVSEADVQPYTDATTATQAFEPKMAEYNEFAKVRNLTIEESRRSGVPLLQFKNSKGYVVREIEAFADQMEVNKDTFYELTSNGEVRQSVVKDRHGKIIQRTITEFRQWWGKASTVTLDYENGVAYSGLYLDGKLTDQNTHDIDTGKSLFANIARRSR